MKQWSEFPVCLYGCEVYVMRECDKKMNYIHWIRFVRYVDGLRLMYK